MCAREHLFVINPKSFDRTSDLDEFISAVGDCFQQTGQPHFIHVSRFPRDAIRAIRTRMERVGAEVTVRVYAVGGDGILFDCLNGIIGLDNAELAPVPYGKSNDFVRAFGEGKAHLFRNIAAMTVAPVIRTDVLFCGNMYALNTCTIGMEAYTTHRAIELNTRYKNFRNMLPRPVRNFLYSFMFFLGGIIYVMSSSATGQRYSLRIDGDEFTGNYTTINIANGPCYGGDKRAAVAAVPDDGLLDTLLFKSTSRFHVIRVATRYIYGHYRNFPDYISYRQAKEVTVRSEKPMVLQLDGEIFFDTNITVRVIPSAVKIVAANGMTFERRPLSDES